MCGGRLVVLASSPASFVDCGGCTGGELPAAKITIGNKIADFTLLKAAGGKPHPLYEFKGNTAVAVVCIATRCSYSNAFDHVTAKLAREYADRGVAFVGINANKTEPASKVAKHARAHVLLLNFCGTCCEPCREKFPAVVQLHQNYRQCGLSWWPFPWTSRNRSLPSKNFSVPRRRSPGVTGTTSGTSRSSSIPSTRAGRGGMPASYLYNQQGRLVSSCQGAIQYDEFERAVLPLLR